MPVKILRERNACASRETSAQMLPQRGLHDGQLLHHQRSHGFGVHLAEVSAIRRGVGVSSLMKLLELRPPLARLMQSAVSFRRSVKPLPQPALSVTVESPQRTIWTLPGVEPGAGLSAANPT